MPHATTSQTIAARIEDLYGQPLATLEAHAGAHPHDSMLAALTSSHSHLQIAEHSIAFQLDRLRQLADPAREMGRFEAGHILDCARRIAESVASRDAYAHSVSAVLGGLCRTPSPGPIPPAMTAFATPAPAPAPATRTR